MSSKYLSGMAITLVLVLAGMMSISWAQGGRGQGQGRNSGECAGGECAVAFDGPMDSHGLISGKLAAAIADEYHARAFYAAVLDRFGDVRPFSRIIMAEQRHIEALERLYEKYSLDVPEDEYTGESFVFDSLAEAAQAGLDAEIANAGLYDDLLQDVTDPDVIAVFENLQWASNERHLPALQRYIDGGGQGQGRGNRCRGGRGCGRR